MTAHHNRLNIAPTRASSLLTRVILALRMKSQGKIATHQHFAAEIQLINNELSKQQHQRRYKLRPKLEGHNTILIANGLNYQERKLAIQAYAQDLRAVSIQEQAA